MFPKIKKKFAEGQGEQSMLELGRVGPKCPLVCVFIEQRVSNKAENRGNSLNGLTGNIKLPHSKVELHLCFPAQRAHVGHSLKCVIIEPAGHSFHCDRNVWLPVLHRKPPIPLFYRTILQCHVDAGVGGGRGVSKGTDICSWQLLPCKLPAATCCDTMNRY